MFIFRQEVMNWIIDAKRKLINELDRLSELGSRRSGSTCISRRSKDGSRQAARTHVKAKLATLLGQCELQSKEVQLLIKNKLFKQKNRSSS
ncbi:hypothetical protein LSH36_1052g00001 [Paralvinella palmiformis]|uniref:Uncharacterized protein n=1 Tax=Paralvinella palmiformis TaxID=53620 RepID=A0AAD9MSU3_9ANNE|nr:hypothetical protein LSH36_1052g00001 [Paralvinella palmiformis]